jgi:hypothetical protein
MTGRVADRLRAEGHPWPDEAAALLAERGRLGLDRKSFARHFGIDPIRLAAVEDGNPIVLKRLGASLDL